MLAEDHICEKSLVLKRIMALNLYKNIWIFLHFKAKCYTFALMLEIYWELLTNFSNTYSLIFQNWKRMLQCMDYDDETNVKFDEEKEMWERIIKILCKM